MDRVELTAADIMDLMDWRDEHRDLVRSDPKPLKAVEIVIIDNGYRIKAIRKGASLRLHLNISGQSAGHCEFTRRDRTFVAEAGGIRFRRDAIGDNKPEDVARSMLTVYASLMAIMAFGWVEIEPTEDAAERAAHKPSGAAHRKPSKRVTYILRRSSGAFLVTQKGSHASPKGIFSVRGHFRHYKSGKVVWIAEYKKGTGKRRAKTYKLGGNNARSE